MRLATIRTPEGTRAVRVDVEQAVETGDADVRALLEDPDWRARATSAQGTQHPLEGVDYAPLVPAPEKIICVGFNYRDHLAETGRPEPEYPEFFSKYAPALIGAYDEIELPRVSTMIDWEAELTVVIGAPVRHADDERAAASIAGYTIMNDVSVRDYQRRTSQFVQGKTFEHTTPLGPVLVTPDELPDGGWAIGTQLDGETMQSSTTDQLLFSAVDLIKYVSTILTLNPGDLIATGTPGGIGSARRPQRWLTDGAELVTSVQGIGKCRNTCRLAEPVS